jgi:hypothetical protein
MSQAMSSPQIQICPHSHEHMSCEAWIQGGSSAGEQVPPWDSVGEQAGKPASGTWVVLPHPRAKLKKSAATSLIYRLYRDLGESDQRRVPSRGMCVFLVSRSGPSSQTLR